ncbi:MAG TPA: hypothetical protein PKA82_07900 [Pyrinomonadaceae bacterium]|nr:hypothetical protein [Pyrinomonadaceae bacterium]
MTTRKLQLKRVALMLFFAATFTVLGTVATNAQHHSRRASHHRQDHDRRVVRAPVSYGNSGYYGNDGRYGNSRSYPTRRPAYYPPQRRRGVGSVFSVIFGGGRASQHRRHH